MPRRDLVGGVVQLGNVLTRKLGPLFARSGITPQQWAVISVLAAEGSPMSLASIARAMLVSKQNMTGMVARLEQLGFAERSEDARDLRSSRVALTRRGKMLVEKLAPAYEEWLEKTAGNVSARDLQTLSRTVERLIQALEASDPEP